MSILIKGMEMPESCSRCFCMASCRLWKNIMHPEFNRHRNCPLVPVQTEGKGYILMPQEEYVGLKRKYVVLKSDNGECVENCFVLRPDKDQAAIAALNAYAGATENQVLATDIRKWLSTIIPAEEEKQS